MSVHYKFKSTLNFDTITFDGLHISVGDLKREIVHQKHLGKIGDFDLQITNAQTKEEYQDDAYLIPKNTTLIISRIPVAHHSKKGWDTQQLDGMLVTSATAPKHHDTSNVDLFKMQGSEEDKIQAMMLQSTADYDPKTYHRIKGQSQTGEVPITYRCNKCKKGGHWIKNCPYNIGKEHQDVKRNTGIPRSFRDKPELPQQSETKEPIIAQQKVPDDLLCSICHDLFLDAVMIPCCGSSFCDDCVRTALLESEDNECPDCKEKGCSPGSLIPNRFLRNSVNAFKNETGYKTSFKNGVQQNDNSNTLEKTAPKEEECKLNNPTLEEKSSISLSTDEVLSAHPTSSHGEKNDDIEKEKTTLDPDENKIGKLSELQTAGKPVLNDNQPPKGRDITLHPNPPGIENSLQMSPSRGQTERKQSPSLEYNSQYKPSKSLEIESTTKEKKATENIQVQNERSIQPLQSGQSNYHHHLNLSDRNNKLLENIDSSKRGQKMTVFKPPAYTQLPLPPRMTEMHMQHCIPASYNNGYNDIIPRQQPIDYGIYTGHHPHHHHHYQMNNVRSGYPPATHLNINSAPIFPNSNLASIYQGVAAKVGTGVIDDPLEAFNRIMKEKEKQKDERRRSPERRRSRTPERLQKSRFRSPPYDRVSGREMLMSRDKRPRSREGDRRREHLYDRKIRYSGRGSASPIEKRIRSLNQRSPSPKVGYPYSSNDKSIKANDANMESIEPPPPGFESIQSIQRETEARDHGKYGKPTSPKLGTKITIRKSSIQSGNEVKRARKGLEKKEKNDLSRSLTPPSKPKLKKLYENVVDMEKSSIKFEPEKSTVIASKEVLLNEEKECVENELNDTSFDKFSTQLKSDSSCKDPYTNRKSESKEARKSRDHKKKKKCRTERKKTKKDKKDKRRKSLSPKDEQTQQTDTTFIRQKHLDLNTNSEKQSSSDGKVANLEPNLHIKPNTVRNGTPRDGDHSRNAHQSKIIKNTTSPEFKRLDSVLDIEGYDTDFDDLGNPAKKLKNLDMQVSKWEREDQNVNPAEKEPFYSDNECLHGKQNLITTDVIRKAENAIFARAINAIRPVEFKITIPTTSLSQERAVLIKSDVEKRSPSPKTSKSIKDRLGSKIVQQKERSQQPSRESRDRRRSSVDNKEVNERRNSRREKYVRSESTQNMRNHFKSRFKYDSKDRKNRKIGLVESDFEHNTQKEKNNFNYNEGRSRNRISRDRRNSSRDRNDKNKDLQKNKNIGLKTKDCRTVVSVASKPSRIDNPFRKFEKNEGTHLPSAIKSSTKYMSSSSLDSQLNSDDKQKKKRKDKKIKKRSKFSSMESLNSESGKQVKSKKKIKSVKKKKKSSK